MANKMSSDNASTILTQNLINFVIDSNVILDITINAHFLICSHLSFDDGVARNRWGSVIQNLCTLKWTGKNIIWLIYNNNQLWTSCWYINPTVDLKLKFKKLSSNWTTTKKNNSAPTLISPIAHFWKKLGLFFKTRLGAQPFLWK